MHHPGAAAQTGPLPRLRLTLPERRERGLFQQGRELLWWYVEEVGGVASGR